MQKMATTYSEYTQAKWLNIIGRKSPCLCNSLLRLVGKRMADGERTILCINIERLKKQTPGNIFGAWTIPGGWNTFLFNMR